MKTTAPATSNDNQGERFHDQKLVFYHPTASGTGAALSLDLRFNRGAGDRYNCFFMEMALQKTTAGRDGERKVPATFDWEHKLTVKLSFMDVCEMLAVLEGRADKAGGQRSGIYHQNGASNTVISLQKAEKAGFYVGLSKKNGDNQPIRVQLTIGEAEAIGLRSVFQAALLFLAFHGPLLGGIGRLPVGQGTPEAA